MRTIIASVIVGLLAAPVSAKRSVKIVPGGVSIENGERSVDIRNGAVHAKGEESSVSIERNGKKVTIRIGTSNTEVTLDETPAAAFKCGANDDKTIKNAYIKVKGDGVSIKGNCDVTIVDSHIEGTGFGIRASGNATVVIKNSTVIGKKGAVHASGNSDVKNEKSKTKGKIIVKGNADYEKDEA